MRDSSTMMHPAGWCLAIEEHIAEAVSLASGLVGFGGLRSEVTNTPRQFTPGLIFSAPTSRYNRSMAASTSKPRSISHTDSSGSGIRSTGPFSYPNIATGFLASTISTTSYFESSLTALHIRISR